MNCRYEQYLELCLIMPIAMASTGKQDKSGVGELSDLLPEWMQMYFDFVQQGYDCGKSGAVHRRVPCAREVFVLQA
jgi:hypothetical protein